MKTSRQRVDEGARAQQPLARAAVTGALAVLAICAQPAAAGPAEQANRIYQRLNGVPPTQQQLQAMTAMIPANAQPGDPGLVNAAIYATDPANGPAFYNVTLKTFVTPWTNRDSTVFAPLNDYTATVIGMVRDDVDFSTALSADILYTFAGGVPAVSASDNSHYAQAETSALNMADKNVLVKSSQTAAYGSGIAPAGLFTTRGGSSAFFINGTNRAMFRFTMINHLCHDLQTVMDTTRPADRIRQDVARSPGGDGRLFLNTCAGCHTGMDPMAQAFAYYNFAAGTTPGSGQLVYTPNVVQAKYFINSQNFPFGYITPDDSWENRWRQGVNSTLGWDPALPGSGKGAASLGQELARSDAFAQCQVQKVFQAVCYRAPQSAADQAVVASIKSGFKSGGYKMRSVFEQVAANCAGQ